MLLLDGVSDSIRVKASAAVALDVHASFVDMDSAGTTITPGRKNTLISTVSTTAVVAAPAASTFRTVKTITVRNRHATTANTVTVEHFDGTNAAELISATLAAGEVLHYHENAGFWVTDASGQAKVSQYLGRAPAALNALNLVVLSADVVNSNATANTIADVTGLSFPVTAGLLYFFRFNIFYNSAATSTGSRWAINGPTSPTNLAYRSQYGLTTTSETINNGLAAYDLPAASNASTPVVGSNNAARIDGFIRPSADGTVIARFASEITSSAITARAGSFVEWYQVA